MPPTHPQRFIRLLKKTCWLLFSNLAGYLCALPVFILLMTLIMADGQILENSFSVPAIISAMLSPFAILLSALYFWIFGNRGFLLALLVGAASGMAISSGLMLLIGTINGKVLLGFSALGLAGGGLWAIIANWVYYQAPFHDEPAEAPQDLAELFR